MLFKLRGFRLNRSWFFLAVFSVALVSGLITPIRYAFATTASASTVYGQANFTSNSVNQGGSVASNTLSSPYGIAVDASNKVFIADWGNKRVLSYPAGNTTATGVYGQANLSSVVTTCSTSPSSSCLASANAVALDSSGGVYITDSDNSRVLYFASGATSASKVYGQEGSYTAGTCNIYGAFHAPSATSLCNPSGLALDSTGGLYVVDGNNHRVLYYASGSTTASRVYGQPNYTSNAQNSGGLSAISLYGPAGIALDSGNNLYIADSLNNRVLYYASGSTTASRVYGQAGSFTTSTVNNGGVSASSLNNPESVAVSDGGTLFISDHANNRVLAFAGSSTTASAVYGQPNFTSNTENNGGLSASTLKAPFGIAIANNGTLFIADTGNNRSLGYPNANLATNIVFTTQPGDDDSRSTTNLSPQPVLTAKDGLGNIATNYSGTVSVSLYHSGSLDNTDLHGTTTATFVNGIATFSNLRVDTVGTGYTLHATTGVLPTVTSNTFRVFYCDPITNSCTG